MSPNPKIEAEFIYALQVRYNKLLDNIRTYQQQHNLEGILSIKPADIPSVRDGISRLMNEYTRCHGYYVQREPGNLSVHNLDETARKRLDRINRDIKDKMPPGY